MQLDGLACIDNLTVFLSTLIHAESAEPIHFGSVQKRKGGGLLVDDIFLFILNINNPLIHPIFCFFSDVKVLKSR